MKSIFLILLMTSKDKMMWKLGIYLFWFFIIGLSFLLYKYRRSRDKKVFLKSSLFRSSIYCFSIVIASLLIVNIFFSNKDSCKIHNTDHASIGMMVQKVEGNKKEAEANPYDIDKNYNYVSSHFKLPEIKADSAHNYFKRDDHSLKEYYFGFLHSDDSVQRDIGNFCLGLSSYYLKDRNKALEYFASVSNKELKYLNLFSGNCLLELKSSKAEAFFKKEISIAEGLKIEAQKKLIVFYQDKKKNGELLNMLLNSETKNLIPYDVAVELYFINHYFLEYYELIFYNKFKQLSPKAIIAALLILLIWFYYIREIDLYEKENPWSLVLVLFLGMVFSFLTFFISDYNQYVLGNEMNGNFWNDFIYCFLGIGAVEEFVKFLPVIILFIISDEINDSYDFILYACISALGFAFVENLFYFQKDSLGIIHARALTSVVGHMIDSSIVAYGFILAKYRRGFNKVGIVALFFVLGCLTHGFYDFLLFKNAYLLFIFVFLIMIFVWVVMINNAHNNSEYFTYYEKLKYENLQVFLSVSLCLVLFFEYVLNGWNHGADAANKTLVISAFESILIVLFAVRLTQFDLIKGHWITVNFRSDGSKNFLTAFFTANTIIPKNFVGHYISIKNYPHNRMLKVYLPGSIEGRIIDRKIGEIVKRDEDESFKDDAIFVIKLHAPYYFSDIAFDYVLIRFLDRRPSLKWDKNILTTLYLVPDKNLLVPNELKMQNFHCLGRACVNEVELASVEEVEKSI